MVTELQSKLNEDIEIESKEIMDKLQAESNQNDTLTDISQTQGEFLKHLQFFCKFKFEQKLLFFRRR